MLTSPIPEDQNRNSKLMSNRKNLSFLLVAAALAFTSCNRGYGCPTNLSEGLSLTDMTELVSVIFAGLL